MLQDPKSLRDVLIDAGLALLEDGGMRALTLRQTAARAGVSHAAPAHHFDGLPGLLTAMAARAFKLFADALHDGRERGGSDPLQRLLGMTNGYLTFADHHAGLFHLMFVSHQVNRTDPTLGPHAARSYQILREACLPFGNGTPDEALELAVWSMVHGYAMLHFATDAPQSRPFSRPPAFAALITQLLAGRENPAINPLAPTPDTR